MRYFFLRFPNGKPKAVTFSYDDGANQDIRLAEIFDKYNLKCTFNHTGGNFMGSRLMPEKIVKEKFINKGHEIAIHGNNHIACGAVNYTTGIADVLDCRRELENKYGMILRGMAYADSGVKPIYTATDYSGIREYLEKLGIAYARVVEPNRNSPFGLPRDWYNWQPSAHHNDSFVFNLIDQFVTFDSNAATVTRREPKLLYIWGHSFEFDTANNWERMEEICQKISNKSDTWYATNIEICDYIKAFDKLILSADRSIVYNPTLYTIWYDKDGELGKIESGETIILG